MVRILYILILAAGLSPFAGAQGTGSIVGEVDANGIATQSLVVALSAPGEPDRQQELRAGGRFEFRNVPSGSYELRVSTFRGDVLYRESVFPSASRIMVRLEHATMVQRPASATVSVTRLRHETPANARKEFARAVQSSRKNDSTGAIQNLTKAIALDPDFMEAHYNLGVQYLKTHNFEEARAEFVKAIALDPGAPAPQINLAYTLMHMERPAEAEVAVRGALRLDGTNDLARYILAVSLLQQRKNMPEALDNLRRVADTVPQAKTLLSETAKSRENTVSAIAR